MQGIDFLHFHLVAREHFNAALFPLSACLAIAISIHLTLVWWDVGKGWTQEPGVMVSCALWWLFSAEALRSFNVWVLFRVQNDRQMLPDYLNDWIATLFSIAAAMLILAFVRCIYLFTPSSWGHKYWLCSIGFAFAFVVLSDLLPPFPLPSK